MTYIELLPKRQFGEVVFDCAAVHQGVSLNQVLMQGLDLNNSLDGVLLRFRKESIRLVADVEAMFYQIRVCPRDRDCVRFLWWPNGDLKKLRLIG